MSAIAGLEGSGAIPADLEDQKESGYIDSIGKRFFSNYYLPNPVSGKWQFWIIPLGAEKFLGKVLYAFGKYLKGGGVMEHPKQPLCEKVVQNLAAFVKRKEISYQLEVMNSKRFNAFCAPGGNIGIHGYMIDILDHYIEKLSSKGYTHPKTGEFISYKNVTKEDLLATVLAHEMIHSDARHQGYLMERTLLARLLGLKKNVEFEADQYGLELMIKAGYRPEAALMFHDISKIELDKALSSYPESQRRRMIHNNSSHPSPIDRQLALFKRVSEVSEKC